MTIDEFWQVIEQAGRDMSKKNRDGNMERYLANLRKILRARGPEEVISFRDHFQDRMLESYDYDLWGAAYVINQGCSDDWFYYFRCWLISMGRKVYEQALADPDSLVEPASRPEIEDFFFEELSYVPDTLYQDMTGTDIPGYKGRTYPREPKGTKQRKDGSDLPGRYPRLWARFAPDPDAR